MTWNNLTFGLNSQLTTTKLGQLMENFAALAGAHSGAPSFATASITAASCKRGNLLTTTASGSATYTTDGTYTLAGGTYSWWTPSYDTLVDCHVAGGGNTAAGVLGFTVPGGTVYIDERYVQASPPYDLGDGEVPLFVFLLMNRDGSIAGTQVAPDPPWANNGPTCLTPQQYAGNRRYRCYKRLGFGGPLIAELSEPQKLAYLRGELELVNDWVEITPEWKNRDRRVVPHPFGVVGADQTVVLLDPFRDEKLFQTLVLIQEASHARDVRQLFLDGEMQIDNERTQMRGLPEGVMPVRARLR